MVTQLSPDSLFKNLVEQVHPTLREQERGSDRHPCLSITPDERQYFFLSGTNSICLLVQLHFVVSHLAITDIYAQDLY